MIIYNKSALDGIIIVEKARKWKKEILIDDAILSEIEGKYGHKLFMPNIFVRAGLFLLTILIASSSFGLISLFTGFDSGIEIKTILFAILCVFVLNQIIKSRNIYKAGIDDALLYIGLSYILGAQFILLEPIMVSFYDNMWLIALLFLPFLIAASILYLDVLITLIALGCLIFIFFSLILKTGNNGKSLLPFLTALLSGGICFAATKLSKREPLRFWAGNFLVLRIASWALIALSLNYFVVRELSIALLGNNLAEGENIPFAFFFYVTTALAPIIFLYLGWKNKDRWLFWLGMSFVIISSLTFKYYFSFGPIEFPLMISGVLAILIAMICLKFEKKMKRPNETSEFKEQSEALLTAEVFGQKSTQEGFKYGGGDFGGGGAGGNF